MKSIIVKYVLVIGGVLVTASCASNLKNYSWYEERNTGIEFNQAIANCEYDLQKMGIPNGRLSAAIAGMQHPTFEACMNRYGFYWRKNP